MVHFGVITERICLCLGCKFGQRTSFQACFDLHRHRFGCGIIQMRLPCVLYRQVSNSFGGTVILSKRGYDVIFYPHIETSHQLLTIDATVEQKPLPELCKESGDILQATCLTDDSLNRGIHRLGFCGVHPASTRVENVRKSLCHTLCK